MAENMMNTAHKTTNETYREKYDGIKWVKYPEEIKKEDIDRRLNRGEYSKKGTN